MVSIAARRALLIASVIQRNANRRRLVSSVVERLFTIVFYHTNELYTTINVITALYSQ